jgi:hypothetical protein
MGDNDSSEANASVLLDTEGRGQRADTPKEESLGVGPPKLELTPPEPAKPKPVKRPHRIPDDWRPSVEDMAYAAGKGMVNGWCEATAEEFRDYWRNATGRNAIKLDWSLAWQGEVRKEIVARRHFPKAHGAVGVRLDEQGRRVRDRRYPATNVG